MTSSRLAFLPPEMMVKIFEKISNPVDIARLLAVSREIAEFTEEICLPNIKQLDIHRSVGDGLPYLINGFDVPKENFIQLIEQTWKRAAEITSLKVNGARILNIFYTICAAMVDAPRTLTELRIRLDGRKFSDRFRMSIDGLEHIVNANANSLEIVEISIKGYSVCHSETVKALGNCMRLREIYLKSFHMNGHYAQMICREKTLDKIAIIMHQFVRLPHQLVYGTNILSGILFGLDKNIRQLTLDLSEWDVGDIVFPGSFPMLSTFTVITHKHRDISNIQEYLKHFACHFPSLTLLRIKNDTITHPHCEDPDNILSFFSTTLNTPVTERTLRVGIYIYIVFHIFVHNFTGRT